ncbi:MAG: hypothetical protein A2V98_17865, partial [Planctomycetes bacterium RBG_16_64_12]
SIGERHLRCFQATGRVELSLCDIREELRRRVARQYGIGRTYADFEAALADGHAAAVIATPAHLHVPMAVRLAEAGTHLLIEKPLSTRLDGIDRLQEAIRRRRLVAAVAYVLRGHPALRAMKQAIDSGRFGEPVQLVAAAGQHFPTYRPAYREIYYADRATGGGAIQDGLTHVLNAAQWLVGPIDSLVADAAHQVLDGVEVEDTVGLLARHGGVLASYSLNQHQAPNECTITVICRRGTARCEFHHHRWRWMVEPDGPWHEEDFGPIERDSLFVAQANAFLDCIEGLARPVCTLDEGIDTLRANLAALASLTAHNWQTVV